MDDRPQLLELWERSARATHHFLSEHEVVALRPLVAAELASDAYDWWVSASADDTLVGFLGYAPDTIEGLFVDPDHRGKGVGTALVAHATGLSTGVLRVDVNEENDAALGFYQRLGFVVVGRSPTDGAGRSFPMLHMLRDTRKGAVATP